MNESTGHSKPSLVPIGSARETGDLIEVIEHLLDAAKKGEIIAFAGVGIEPDDCTRMWKGAVPGITKLRVLGAMYHLLHVYECGDDA